MTRLARSLDRLKPHYDAIVVGSGYGGGVAAARLARAGKSVAVLERGREFVTGEFPRRFPELREQLQVTGRRVRMGAPTGLYDVRLGEDMHVLVGCGLGGGSLINAGVALRPDPRVFRHAAWPVEVAQDGLIEEGSTHARRAGSWPARDPSAASRAKYQALALRPGPGCRAAGGRTGGGELRGHGQPGRGSRSPPVRYAGTVAAAATPGPRTRWRSPICRMPRVMAPRSSPLPWSAASPGPAPGTGRCICSVRKRGLAAPRANCASAPMWSCWPPGPWARRKILLRSREAGPRRVSDRLAATASPPMATSSPSATAATSRVNAIGVGPSAASIDGHRGGRLRVRPDRDRGRLASWTRSLTIPGGRAALGAGSRFCLSLFLPNGRVLGALQSLVGWGLQGAVARTCRRSSPCRTTARPGRLVLEDGRVRAALARRPRTEPGLPARRRRPRRAGSEHAGGAYVAEPAGRQP